MITLNLDCFKPDVQSELAHKAFGLYSIADNTIQYVKVTYMVNDLKDCGILQ